MTTFQQVWTWGRIHSLFDSRESESSNQRLPEEVVAFDNAGLEG